jgi:cytochrome c-type biogenesis protein
MTENLTVLGVFIAGLGSVLSPCVLPLVPAYIANLAGATALDTKTRANYLPTLLHSLSFVLGFSLIFIILGASVGLVGRSLNIDPVAVRQIGGCLIIAFGIFLIAAYKFPWLNYEKRLNLNAARSPGYLRSILIGAIFAFGWTPCVGPILGAVLTLAWSSQTVGQGALLLVVYSLGLGIPFILIGLAWGKIMPVWKSINKYLWIISILSGLLLIAIGILMLTGSLSWLSQFA